MMGFGHRIYKVRDPRADVLKDAVAKLPETAGRLAYAAEVEKGAIAALRKYKPGRPLDTNVAVIDLRGRLAQTSDRL